MNIENIGIDNILNIITSLDSEAEVYNFCRMNQETYNICKGNKNTISKHMLVKFYGQDVMALKPIDMSWSKFYNSYKCYLSYYKELYEFIKHYFKDEARVNSDISIPQWHILEKLNEKNPLLYYKKLYEKTRKFLQIESKHHELILPNYELIQEQYNKCRYKLRFNSI